QHGRLPDADGDALTGLAAGADTGIERHVIADRAHLFKRLATRADQRCALDRRRQLAILDEIGLRAAEDELARRDIDLSAAEIDGVKTLLHGFDNFLLIAVAAQHIGVRHPRHGQIRITFAPAIAGGFHAHQAGVLAILHIADKDAVLDQRRAACRGPLIINAERAAPIRDRPVIDDRDAGGGHPLAHQVREYGGFLAVEIAFKAVPDRFMQDDARPARAENDIHLAGRRIDGVEVDNRLARRLVNGRLPGRFLKIEGVARAPAGAVGARLAPSVLLDDNRDVEAD